MRFSALQKRNAGIELLRVAVIIKQYRTDLSDQQAFKLAMLSNPKLAEAYIGCPVRQDGFDDVKKFLTTT